MLGIFPRNFIQNFVKYAKYLALRIKGEKLSAITDVQRNEMRQNCAFFLKYKI